MEDEQYKKEMEELLQKFLEVQIESMYSTKKYTLEESDLEHLEQEGPDCD